METQFQITPEQLLQKTKNGPPVFRNNVAMAQANLPGAPNYNVKAINRVKATNKVASRIYTITKDGKAILKGAPMTLTYKDLSIRSYQT